MTLCYLSLGSNLNSPERQLRRAIASLRKLSSVVVTDVADFYHNPAQGRKSQPAYCNTVLAIRTRLTPFQLLAKCQQLELRQGRVRKVKWGARTLDIDILFYGHLCVNSPVLKIPHPRLYEREFVLKPLLQILPSTQLPCGQEAGNFL